MGLQHGKVWSWNTLLVGFCMWVLVYLGDIFVFIGVLIGFVWMVFIAVLYADSMTLLEEARIREEEAALKDLQTFDEV